MILSYNRLTQKVGWHLLDPSQFLSLITTTNLTALKGDGIERLYRSGTPVLSCVRLYKHLQKKIVLVYYGPD